MKFIFCLALFLVGCQTTPVSTMKHDSEPTPMVVDESCVALSKYVRAVALLRDINVPDTDVDYILVKNPDMPVASIQRYVYDNKDINYVSISKIVFLDCQGKGYSAVIEKFNKDEEVFREQQAELAMTRIVEAKMAIAEKSVPVTDNTKKKKKKKTTTSTDNKK